MSYYLVAQLNFKNEDWWPDYAKATKPMIAKHGGKIIARTRNFDKLSPGEDKPSLIVLIEWPTKDAAKAFTDDPDYQPYIQARLDGSTGTAFMVLGEDEADTL